MRVCACVCACVSRVNEERRNRKKKGGSEK